MEKLWPKSLTFFKDTLLYIDWHRNGTVSISMSFMAIKMRMSQKKEGYSLFFF